MTEEKCDKPTVKFIRYASSPRVGRNALVIPVDHPNESFNGERVSTGKVVSVSANGVDFETLDIRYVHSANK